MSETQMMHRYGAYNLGIHSTLLLPECLVLVEAMPDIIIRVEKDLDKMKLKANSYLNPFYSINKQEAFLHFTEVGTFFINNGREISIFPLPNTEERLIRLPLLGGTFAVLLHQRGKLVLHASAVAIGDEAVIFVGNKGEGKSTMASILCSRGHQLLADDIVAIEFNEANHPVVLPGFPQLKLYPDAVRATSNDDPEKLAEIASNLDKRSRQTENFCSRILPLKAVYVLGVGNQVLIRRLIVQEAIRFLIANSYLTRFSSDWLRNGIAESNLGQITTIVNETPMYVLERTRDLSAIENVALAIENKMKEAS